MLQKTLPRIREKGAKIKMITGEGLGLGEVSLDELKSLFGSGEIGALRFSGETSKQFQFPPFRITVVDEREVMLVFPRIYRGEIVSVIALYNTIKPLAESIAFIYTVIWKIASSAG
nr:hypothetical protein [Candidatus Freyarchaeota archaeon]